MPSPLRRSGSILLALGLVLALAPTALAQRPVPRLIETVVVPADTPDSAPVAFSHKLDANTDYQLVATGVINAWPSNGTGRPFSTDAAFCFDVPGYCDAPTPAGSLQYLVYDGTMYRGFGSFRGGPFDPRDHRYTVAVKYPYSATIKLSVADTVLADNTGSFQVGLYELEPDDFMLYGLSCADGKRYTDTVSLPNGGCQSVRIQAEGPSEPRGAGMDIQYRTRKGWRGLPATCGAGLPPSRCQILVEGRSPKKTRYRAVLRQPASGGKIVAVSNVVTVDFLA